MEQPGIDAAGGGVHLRQSITSLLPARARRPRAPSIIVFVVILAIFATVSYVSFTSNQRNNQRLLSLRTKEVGSLLTAVLPIVETPLASAVELAIATRGDPAQFTRFISQDVGNNRTFASASLWRLGGPRPVFVARVGMAQRYEPASKIDAAINRAVRTSTVDPSIISNLNTSEIAYAYAGAGPAHQFVAIAQTLLPPHRIARASRSNVLAGLQFALYLGKTANMTTLIESSTRSLPIAGPTATAVVPFGDSNFTIVASSPGQLGGTLSSDSWWVIAITGGVLAILGAIVSQRLIRRRESAEDAADVIERLYAEQRDVAITLQQALLPESVPTVPKIEIRTRYVPGGEGLEIGGDWYDVLEVGDDALLLVVGDVSGRGLRAATIMASLHYAIRAFALQGDAPEVILAKLTRLIDIRRDHHFATILCVQVDTVNREMTFVNAGHPPPLLRIGDRTEFVAAPVGPPIGIPGSHDYVSYSMKINDDAMLLAYTDGLIERKGEHLDIGLDRLRDLVSSFDANGSLDTLLSDLIVKLTPSGPVDDIALLGLTWHI